MEALGAGEHPNVRLYACRPNPWTAAIQRRRTVGPASTLVLPADADPDDLRWPPVELVASITGLPGSTVQALASALARDGCRLAYLLDGEHPERDLRVIPKGGAR